MENPSLYPFKRIEISESASSEGRESTEMPQCKAGGRNGAFRVASMNRIVTQCNTIRTPNESDTKLCNTGNLRKELNKYEGGSDPNVQSWLDGSSNTDFYILYIHVFI